MAIKLGEIWERITGNKPNPLDNYVMRLLQNRAIYPDDNNETYLQSYTGNPDVFTVVNKITEPASTVPIYQYDKEGNIVENGLMLARLNKPNGYQSRDQFIEAALSFYFIFGNCYTAEESLEISVNKGPARLDVLPPQWMSIVMGTVFDPIRGYQFYPLTQAGKEDYRKDQVFHWKEFNPDYDLEGGHLKGMSRLKPLLKSVIGSAEGYNSLVKAFQNQGAWGILTMLDEEGKTQNLNNAQKSLLKNKFKSDSKRGDLTISNLQASWTKIGLTMVEMEVLKSLSLYKGNLSDAFNVPSQLFSGSTDRTYNNYKEAEQALWRNAIQPSLDSYLQGLSTWLAPKFGEEGNVLKADYSEVACLQTNKAEMVTWMIQARAFTKNEIREACGFEMLPDPAMDVIYESAGQMPLAELGMDMQPEMTEEVMKQLNLSDYRLK